MELFHRAFRCVLLALALACGGRTFAADAPAPILAKIKAHPALWVVHSPTATAWLFGSIHLLPPNIDWHSRAVDAAIASSDVFVFEAPLGQTGVTQTADFVRANGMLPPDEFLPQLLDANARKEYQDAILQARSALADEHVSPEALAHMRPWLASIVIETAMMQAAHYSPEGGVDRQVFALATDQHKTIESFETVDEQLSMLMSKDRKLEIEEFDASMKELKTDMGEIGPLIDAWCEGRVNDVGKLLNAALSTTPGAMKLLIYDRNTRWAARMVGMLAQHHTYFITVGAGHLSGPRGLPALLTARGYKVELSTSSP
jgi:hypothetical protein